MDVTREMLIVTGLHTDRVTNSTANNVGPFLTVYSWLNHIESQDRLLVSAQCFLVKRFKGYCSLCTYKQMHRQLMIFTFEPISN